MISPAEQLVAAPDPSATGEVLKPYVPRLVIEWLRTSPGALHREFDATLVFVDISGFTALTERLAKKGKIGAELMRDTLDGVFRALLDEAYDWGAGLLKWGGDALLLLFDGPEHELRACRAAWEMQRTIDRVGRLHLTGGTLVLRMSVGIGTGRFHFFMTGSVHRELLIAGPAMTETLTMEAIADAGEIGISHALAARLDPSCVGPPKEATILLAAPPEVDRRRAPDVGDVSSIDIASCIPVATRGHVLLQKSEPEHRTITAAFIDLMDTDRLLEAIGPEALAVGLDERIRQIEEAALQFEVPFYETDVGKSSVKALLTAGAPTSTGHDEERMLRTLREVMDHPGVVDMRIGVNTGRVFTGDFGPSYRRAYRVFGDAINTAARVMSKAEAGQILSTEIVLTRSRTIFDTTPIPPFAAKGKALPVHASIVGAAIGRRPADQRGLPLVGRDAELQQVLRAVELTLAGAGTVVEIHGEPGVGKSRLFEEVVARSPAFRVLASRCEEYEASTPYFPMRAVIRDVLGVGDADLDDTALEARLREAVADADPSLVPWIPLLGILLGLDLPATAETRSLDDQFLRERLAEVTIQFLVATLRGPTMLAIEDAHHIDESTRDLIVRMFEARESHRAMLILASQSVDRLLPLGDGDDPVAGDLSITLEPLPAESLTQILELATEDDPLRPHVVEEIARRSGGNALFLFELLDAVRESGSLESLPDSIEALIAGEIDRLAPLDRTVLRYASVLGASFDPDLLEAVIPDTVELSDDAWRRLGDFVDVAPGGTARFRNRLIRDAAYEGLPFRRRRALHAAVGRAIEDASGERVDDEAGALSFHFYAAQVWDKAWHYSQLAGDRAMRIYASADASRYYERALVAGRRLRSVPAEDLANLYERWSDAIYLLGRYDDADRALKAARRLLGRDAIAAAPLVIKQSIITSRTGRYRQTNARVAQGLRALEGRRGPEAAAARARLMVINAGTRFLENRRTESIRWARRAERQARRSDAKDALAQSYKLLDMALKENGEVEKAIYSTRALALYEELGDLRSQALILNNLGIIAQERSHWDEALDLYQRSLAIMEQTGDRTNAALAKYNIAEILGDQGRLDEAEALLRDVLRVWRASGVETDVAEARRELGKLLARRGEFAAARELYDASLAELTRAGKSGEALSTTVRMRELDVLVGFQPDLLASIDDVIASTSVVEGGGLFRPMLRRLRGWALAQSDQVAAAERVLSEALATARSREDRFEIILVLDALIAIRHRAGADVAALGREWSAAKAALGIVALPPFPLVPREAPELVE